MTCKPDLWPSVRIVSHLWVHKLVPRTSLRWITEEAWANLGISTRLFCRNLHSRVILSAKLNKTLPYPIKPSPTATKCRLKFNFDWDTRIDMRCYHSNNKIIYQLECTCLMTFCFQSNMALGRNCISETVTKTETTAVLLFYNVG